jgi:hypothetical protein
MVPTKPVQSRTAEMVVVLGLFTLLGAWNGVAALFGPPEMNPRHAAIAETAFATFVLWWLAAVIAASGRGSVLGAREARIAYTWGCAMCLLHVAVAFHLAHAWSHAAAVEHVERASGFGAGLYVNYAFAGVWVADVVWAWVAFESYASRPRWLNWSVHGFLAFIMFNAAVVFNTGFTRAICALFFVALAVQAFRAWRPRGEKQEPGQGRVLESIRDDPAGHSPT